MKHHYKYARIDSALRLYVLVKCGEQDDKPTPTFHRDTFRAHQVGFVADKYNYFLAVFFLSQLIQDIDCPIKRLLIITSVDNKVGHYTVIEHVVLKE